MENFLFGGDIPNLNHECSTGCVTVTVECVLLVEVSVGQQSSTAKALALLISGVIRFIAIFHIET
jgi:hypothetical protein